MKYGPPLDAADIDVDLACRVCGCTQFDACRGGCAWVADPAGAGPLCSACLPLATHELQLAAMAKLKVTVQAHGRLVIDATELVSAAADVERWVLCNDSADGLWVHYESGERGSLSELLRAIARCYLAVPDPAVVRA